MSQATLICFTVGFGFALFQFTFGRYRLAARHMLQAQDISELLFVLWWVGAWYTTLAFVAYWIVALTL